MLVCPSRDVSVRPGDVVAVVGREPDLRLLRPELEEEEVTPHPRVNRLRMMWRYVASFAEETGKPLRLIVVAQVGEVLLPERARNATADQQVGE